METPILTPMQQAIEEIKVLLKEKFAHLQNDLSERQEHCTHGEIFGLSLAVSVIKEYLPKEQEAIERTIKRVLKEQQAMP